MFDHLGPIPKIRLRKKPINYRAYLSFLLLAVAVYLVAWSAQSGSGIVAAPVEQPQVLVKLKKIDQTIVAGSTNLSILSLQINTSLAGVALKSLNINSQGIYPLEFLAGLKLYHNGLQLGQLSGVDDQGRLHFDLGGYVLPRGPNEILLAVADSDNLSAGDILNFSLEDASNLIWSYNAKEYLAQGEWPIIGGTINIVEQGSLWAYNKNKKDLAVLADQASKLAEFSLAVDGERVDLKKLTFQYKTLSSESVNNFSLVVNEQVVANTKAQGNTIEFVLAQPLSLAINEPLTFSLLGQLAVGDYDFELASAQGNGLASGQEISLAESLSLVRVVSQNQLIKFSLLPIDKSLSQDWLAVANLSASKLGSGSVALHRLTWRLNSNLVAIKSAKILINDKVKDLDLVIKDNKIIAKTAWDDPIILSELGVNIKLLLQIDEFQAGAFIQTSLLGDDSLYQVEQWSDNLLWSAGASMYNAYLLPSLPLSPQLISY